MSNDTDTNTTADEGKAETPNPAPCAATTMVNVTHLGLICATCKDPITELPQVPKIDPDKPALDRWCVPCFAKRREARRAAKTNNPRNTNDGRPNGAPTTMNLRFATVEEKGGAKTTFAPIVTAKGSIRGYVGDDWFHPVDGVMYVLEAYLLRDKNGSYYELYPAAPELLTEAEYHEPPAFTPMATLTFTMTPGKDGSSPKLMARHNGWVVFLARGVEAPKVDRPTRCMLERLDRRNFLLAYPIPADEQAIIASLRKPTGKKIPIGQTEVVVRSVAAKAGVTVPTSERDLTDPAERKIDIYQMLTLQGERVVLNGDSTAEAITAAFDKKSSRVDPAKKSGKLPLLFAKNGAFYFAALCEAKTKALAIAAAKHSSSTESEVVEDAVDSNVEPTETEADATTEAAGDTTATGGDEGNAADIALTIVMLNLRKDHGATPEEIQKAFELSKAADLVAFAALARNLRHSYVRTAKKALGEQGTATA